MVIDYAEGVAEKFSPRLERSDNRGLEYRTPSA